MTREEAIKIIDCYDIGFYDLSGEKIPADKLAEAFDMAIEALNREQEKYDVICNELVALKSDLNKPIEVAIAYENSIAIVRKYAERF